MLINMDLAGAEWHVTAHLCRDPAMLEVSKSKKSPHPITGSRMTGLSPETIIKEDKIIQKENDPLVIDALRKEHCPEVLRSPVLPRTMSIRQAAKKANHGLNYREGYRTFALKNELSEAEADKIVTLYRRKSYPGLLKWYDHIDEQIKSTRTMTNCFGRKLYFMGALNDETFRAATAFVPQSTVVDITNNAMPLFLNDCSPEFEPARLLAQVHDSLLSEYLDLSDWNRVALFVRRLAFEYLSPTLIYDEPFKLDVDCKIGFNWGHASGGMREIKLTEDIDVLAQTLREGWEGIMSELSSRIPTTTS